MTEKDTTRSKRYTVPEAAKILGIGTDAVRKRIARDTISHEKDADGRVYVYLDAGHDKGHDKGHDDQEPARELVESLREQIGYLQGVIATRDEELRTRAEEQRRRDQDLERRDRIIAALTERLPQALEPPSETRESPQTVEQEPDRSPTRSGTGEAGAVTEGRSEAEPSLLWERVVVVILSILLTLVIVLLVLAQSRFSAWPVYALLGSTTLAWVVFPAVFGFLLGRKVRSLRFWRNVAPVAVILGLVSFIAGGALGRALTGSESGFISVFLAAIPSFVYMFAAVLGNALRRRKREKLVEERPSEFPPEAAPGPQGWTPRQQAFVGLAGTTISALIGLISTILTVLAKT